MRSWVGLACGLLALTLLPAAPAASAIASAPEPGPEPVRILLVGDSVTQGSAGDWTWRYRLWEHFAGVDVDFVGPREDLYDNVTEVHGSLAYADPAFDRDHAARWGMQVDVPDVPIAELVETYQPDVVVEMLGFNDLLHGGRAPEVVAGRIGSFVEEARAVDPAVDFVLAEATQHWFAGVPAFNAALRGLVGLATEESQVVVARTSVRYDKLADTWDTSHPNARGEVRIAAAVADGLHAIGVGPAAARPLRFPPVGPRTPPGVEATALDGAVRLTWTGPPGATSYLVWERDATAAKPWRGPWPVTGSTWTAYLLTNGHRYQYRLQPVKGDDRPEGGVFARVTATPFRPPPAPVDLRAEAGRRCVVLRWQRPEFATRYRVERKVADGWRPLAWVGRPRFTAQRLPAARSWRFRVRAWHRDTPGDAATVKVRRDPAARCA